MQPVINGVIFVASIRLILLFKCKYGGERENVAENEEGSGHL